MQLLTQGQWWFNTNTHIKIHKYKYTNKQIQKYKYKNTNTLTYAIVDPGTVVVKDLDAVVTNGAVAASRRPIELTSDTPGKSVFIEEKRKQAQTISSGL